MTVVILQLLLSNLEISWGTYLTTGQVADYLSVPVSTLYQWRHRGIGPRAARVGRHLRYRLSDVDRWVEQHMSDSSR